MEYVSPLGKSKEVSCGVREVKVERYLG